MDYGVLTGCRVARLGNNRMGIGFWSNLRNGVFRNGGERDEVPRIAVLVEEGQVIKPDVGTVTCLLKVKRGSHRKIGVADDFSLRLCALNGRYKIGISGHEYGGLISVFYCQLMNQECNG